MKAKILVFGIFLELLASQVVNAQIIPDRTLPTNSIVTEIGNVNLINGGTTKGSNLFHSFEIFSVPSGMTAYFNNSPTIRNIFARVTGSSISSIDGLIQANGATNFFLLNPNGILFGPNATLNLGGSFFASSAEAINFADGIQFSAKIPQSTSLLSVDVPSGLVFGDQPGDIKLEGVGHQLRQDFFLPVIGAGLSTSGLRVRPGKTLALVGGNLELNGGILTAPGGRIEVGSVANGFVSIGTEATGWELDYSRIFEFKEISLSTRSLIDASGFLGGSIQVQGNNIDLRDGSVILIQNQGLFPSKGINIKAANSLEISGTDPVAKMIGSIATVALGSQPGGNIKITTPQLKLINGGNIATYTYTNANGGNIDLIVPGTIEIIGESPLTAGNLSSVTTLTFSSGTSGKIDVATGDLLLKDGGGLFSIAFSSGSGGDITINASRSVQVVGVDREGLSTSTISAVTVGSGDAGKIIITTPKLMLQEGGSINASTLSSGKAGDITINASDFVEITGFSINSSVIISSATVANQRLGGLFGLPNLEDLTGDSGTIVINTGHLIVNDYGVITVSNPGKGTSGDIFINANDVDLSDHGKILALTTNGDGGNININANSLDLSSQGLIVASTANGNGGNININTQILSLFNNSEISSSSIGSGNGGNINIFAEAIAADSTSSITANSQNNIGGSITINAEGAIFAPGFIASATSARGTQFDGRVTINSKSVLPTINPPIINPTPEIPSVIKCDPSSGNLAYVGTGGIPGTLQDSYSPDDFLNPEPVQTSLFYTDSETGDRHPFQEAVGWKHNPDGTITFVTDANLAVQFAEARSQCLQSHALPNVVP